MSYRLEALNIHGEILAIDTRGRTRNLLKPFKQYETKEEALKDFIKLSRLEEKRDDDIMEVFIVEDHIIRRSHVEFLGDA